MPYGIAPRACAARSAIVHSGHGLPMMATVSPAAIRYSRASPQASAATRSASSRHVVSRQIPSSFARNATRSGRVRARSTSKPGIVLARSASKFMPGGLYRTGRLLEHAPQPHRAGRARAESDRVVRIARGKRVGALAAAPRQREFHHGPAAESQREAHPDALLQAVEIEVAGVLRHFSPLSEDEEPERVDHSALVANAIRDGVGRPEAVVREAPEPVLVVDVAAAQRRLKVERNLVARARVADDQVCLDREAARPEQASQVGESGLRERLILDAVVQGGPR